MTGRFTRREVLKAAGVLGGFTGRGVAAARTRTVATTRFVEVGISYELAAGNRFPTRHRESGPDYLVDPAGGRVVLPGSSPDAVVERFRGRFTVAANDGVEPGPRRIELVGSRRVVTSTDGGRPLGWIALADAHDPPAVSVERRGRRPVLLTDGSRYDLPASGARTVQLSSRTLRVRGLEYADQVPQRETARREELTAPPEPTTVEVDATPTVSVYDHGETEISRVE